MEMAITLIAKGVYWLCILIGGSVLAIVLTFALIFFILIAISVIYELKH